MTTIEKEFNFGEQKLVRNLNTINSSSTTTTTTNNNNNNNNKLLWDFDIHTDHLISARRTDLIIINKKKRTCKIVDFAVPADHRIKLKECEKKKKQLEDLES